MFCGADCLCGRHAPPQCVCVCGCPRCLRPHRGGHLHPLSLSLTARGHADCVCRAPMPPAFRVEAAPFTHSLSLSVFAAVSLCLVVFRSIRVMLWRGTLTPSGAHRAGQSAGVIHWDRRLSAGGNWPFLSAAPFSTFSVSYFVEDGACALSGCLATNTMERPYLFLFVFAFVFAVRPSAELPMIFIILYAVTRSRSLCVPLVLRLVDRCLLFLCDERDDEECGRLNVWLLFGIRSIDIIVKFILDTVVLNI